jgi:hypothetical protein
MSYRVDGLVDGKPVAFDPGTSILVTGPSMEVEETLLDMVGAAGRNDETGIVISTNWAAPDVVSALGQRSAVAGRLGVIDTTGRDRNPPVSGAEVEYLSSPGDLTGMSLEFAKLVRGFQERGAGQRVRVGLMTVSTMLMYTDVQTAFRFLHVFTSRIRSGELFGVFALDPSMHDDKAVNTIRAIFSSEARVADGEVELRGSGFVVG